MIRLERTGHVSVIVLSRPDQRNALTPEMLRRLAELVRDAESHSRAVVLAGEGKVFCAGFDLALCRANPDGSAMRALLTGLSVAITTMREAPIPVVAAAHGAAIAGGCALLGGADAVVADRAARLGYPVVRIGVSPAVSAPFLASAAGHGPARVRMLDSDLVDGVEAARIGLVHHLVDSPAGVLGEAIRLAADMGSKPASAMRATKAWCSQIAPLDPASGLNASLRLAGGREEAAMLSRGKTTPPAR